VGRAMNIPLVDLKAQYKSIKIEIDAAIQEVLDASAYIGGPFVEEFEQGFGSILGRKHCIGVANGTDALHLTLRALGVGPGDEVLLPVNTFIATSEAVTMAGAKPVFVDAQEENLCIDTKSIINKITPSTRAVLPVHLYGQMAPMNAIREIAMEHDLLVVEDAAQAHLATKHGKMVGSFGSAACFSFYPGKNLGAYGDAGAVVTDSDELAEAIRKLANHGRDNYYGHECEGWNSRLDGLQAAVLTVKLKYLREWTEARQAAAARYRELLSESPGVILPKAPEDGSHVYHLFVVRVANRDKVLQSLRSEGIGASIHYEKPLSALKAYDYMENSEGDYPVAERLAKEILSLPIYPEITEEQQAYVADKLRDLT